MNRILPFRFAVVLLSLCVASCATRKIHPDFKSNEYIKGFEKHFVNQKVKVYHTTMGDVRYTTDRDTLDLLLSGTPLNNVLAHGKTDVPPFYEYFLLVNPSKKNLGLSGFERVHDTLVRGRRVIFAGRGIGDDIFPLSDFQSITESLRAGKGYPVEINPISDVFQGDSKSAQFLSIYSDIASYPVRNERERDYQAQMELTYLCMLGDNPWYREALARRESRYPLRPEVTRTLLEKGLSGKDTVLKALLAQTMDAQVVMFSENHFMPWHRTLLVEVLPALRKQGFRYLALEAVWKDSLLNAGVRPSLKTGFYTREQHFYRLLRTAQDLGFEFVSYDGDSGDRERVQAQNLYRKTLGVDPDARVVVLAGLEHIYEREGGSRTRMAQHFATLYGIDPLTVSQSDLAHYRHQMGSELVLLPSDFLEPARWKQVDLHLVSRLDWEYPEGDFQYVNPYDRPVQLALYHADGWLSDYGYLGDIPEISVLVLPGASFSVSLPEGLFRLLVFDQEGMVLRNEPVPGTEER